MLFTQSVDSIYLIYNVGKQRRLRNFRREIKKYNNDTLLQQDTDKMERISGCNVKKLREYQ